MLVDTSTWIDYFRGYDNPAVERLTEVLDQQKPFFITGVIFQELLQGSINEKEWLMLEEYFRTQRFLEPVNPIETHRVAARMFFLCLRRGYTPRSSIDCLIAQIAIEYQVPVLHNDGGCLRLSHVVPELQ